MHSGDAIHLAFCLYNKIDTMLLKDKLFYDSINLFKRHYGENGLKDLKRFYSNIQGAQDIPDPIFRAMENLSEIFIKKLE